MSDVCDADFFNVHVWPLLEKDVNLQLSEACANQLAPAVRSATEREFVKREFKLASLLGHTSASETKRTPQRETMLAAMQAYTHMYEPMSAIVRDQIERNALVKISPRDDK